MFNVRFDIEDYALVAGSCLSVHSVEEHVKTLLEACLHTGSCILNAPVPVTSEKLDLPKERRQGSPG
jgi:hypothetical protein